MKILLDTNIILRYPKILGLQIPDTTFLVPLDIIQELNARAQKRGEQFDRRVDLIEKASNEGTVSIINSEGAIRRFKDLIDNREVSYADISLIATAINLQNKGDVVKIATADKEIHRIANDNGIEILSDKDIENLLLNFRSPLPNEKSTVQGEIISYERREWLDFIFKAAFGVILSFAGRFVYNHIQVIIGTINIWGTIILILFAGIALFVLREKQRLSYGVFEFIIGVLAIIVIFSSNNFDFSKVTFNLDFNIKLLGGLYIMVRGQDNIVRAIKDTKYGLYLKDKFGIGT